MEKINDLSLHPFLNLSSLCPCSKTYAMSSRLILLYNQKSSSKQRSYIFAVPMLCILNIGTVPMLCILNIGTVPMLCILYVGTVPTFRHFLEDILPLGIPPKFFTPPLNSPTEETLSPSSISGIENSSKFRKSKVYQNHEFLKPAFNSQFEIRGSQ